MSITIDRAAFLKTLNLARPALAVSDIIPILTHFRFGDDEVTAYNDTHAIAASMPGLDLSCCLPGDLLVKALAGLAGQTVVITKAPTEPAVTLSAGRSRIKVPHLPGADYPLSWPSTRRAPGLDVSAALLAGLQACLPGVGNNPSFPARMGVTLDVGDNGELVCYSTDDATISCYLTGEEAHLPGNVSFILPTFLAQQVVAMAKAYPDEDITLYLLDGAIVAKIGNKLRVMSRALLDVEPLDFGSRLSKFRRDRSLTPAAPIPPGWESAFARALLVLDAEPDKVVVLSSTQAGLVVTANSAMGEVIDELEFDGKMPPGDPLHVDPVLVARGSKTCATVAFSNSATLLASDDGKFLQLIAHCAVSTKKPR